MVKSVGKYDLYRTLGEGAYGKVKYGVNRETNEAVAIKILDKEKIQKQNMGAQIKKEILIMKMISHKNVIAVKVGRGQALSVPARLFSPFSNPPHPNSAPPPPEPTFSTSLPHRTCLPPLAKSSSWSSWSRAASCLNTSWTKSCCQRKRRDSFSTNS